MLTRLATLPLRMALAAANVVLDDLLGEPDDLDGYVSTTAPATPPPSVTVPIRLDEHALERIVARHYREACQ